MLRQSYLPIFDLINLNLYLTLKQNKMKKIMKHKFQYMPTSFVGYPLPFICRREESCR